jgi:hypothetical protein
MFMTSTPDTNQPTGSEDPRRRIDFQPQHYPRANGQGAPPLDATGQNDRITLAFLAAYYDLNCAYSRLLEVRNRPDSPERSVAEREQLQAIEKVLILRDACEDRYAPFGVIAEPVVQRGFAVDMKLSFGNVDAAGGPRSDLYTVTAYVPIPLPPGVKLEQLPIKIEGPGIRKE